VTQVTSASTIPAHPHPETTDMEQPEPPRRPTPEASWPRVAWNTVVLWLRRRRDRLRVRWRNGEDELLGLRGGLVLAGAVVVLVVIGGLVYLADPFGLSGGSADSTQNTSAPAVRQTEPEPLPRQERASPATGGATPAPRQASPGSAHAAAGAELAARPGVQVSAQAAELLRSGSVDGRVLIVMAALASGNRLQTVDVPPPGTTAPTSASDLELGVSEVDSVLQWLDSQIVLRPDRLEVRREASRSYIRLIYSSPEPPGLFPS
jgi:hypothetical protein